MKVLLDTHIYVDWVEQIRLTSHEVQAINQLNRKGNIFVSSISFWEIALLAEKNKLERDIKGLTESDLIHWKEESLDKSNVHLLEPTIDDQIQSVYLPKYHKDPFDRLLIAQAKRHQLILLTRDRIMAKYKIMMRTPQQILKHIKQGDDS